MCIVAPRLVVSRRSQLRRVETRAVAVVDAPRIVSPTRRRSLASSAVARATSSAIVRYKEALVVDDRFVHHSGAPQRQPRSAAPHQMARPNQAISQCHRRVFPNGLRRNRLRRRSPFRADGRFSTDKKAKCRLQFCETTALATRAFRSGAVTQSSCATASQKQCMLKLSFDCSACAKQRHTATKNARQLHGTCAARDDSRKTRADAPRRPAKTVQQARRDRKIFFSAGGIFSRTCPRHRP